MLKDEKAPGEEENNAHDIILGEMIRFLKDKGLQEEDLHKFCHLASAMCLNSVRLNLSQNAAALLEQRDVISKKIIDSMTLAGKASSLDDSN